VTVKDSRSLVVNPQPEAIPAVMALAYAIPSAPRLLSIWLVRASHHWQAGAAMAAMSGLLLGLLRPFPVDSEGRACRGPRVHRLRSHWSGLSCSAGAVGYCSHWRRWGNRGGVVWHPRWRFFFFPHGFGALNWGVILFAIAIAQAVIARMLATGRLGPCNRVYCKSCTCISVEQILRRPSANSRRGSSD